ncbi:MAG: GNAT family N-acetyltransferase [Clostridia bacterium]
MNVEKIPACPDDEGFLYELFAATRRGEIASWGFNQQEGELLLQMQFKGQSQSYAMNYPDAKRHLLVVENEKIGSIVVLTTDQEIRLVDLALLPHYGNRGIGTQLLLELQQEATSQQKSVSLSVLNTNPAKRLYQRLGFLEVGNDGVYCQMVWRNQ